MMQDSTAPPLREPSLHFHVAQICTMFDHRAARNRANPCDLDPAKNDQWTNTQREAALKGVVAKDPEHLAQLVSDYMAFVGEG